MLVACAAGAGELPLPSPEVDPPPCTPHESVFARCDAAVVGRVASVEKNVLTVQVGEIVRGRFDAAKVAVPVPAELAEALDEPGTPVTLLLRRSDEVEPGWVLAGGPVRGGALLWNDTGAIKHIASAHRDPAAGLRSREPRTRLAAAYYAAMRFRDAARAIDWSKPDSGSALPEAAGLVDALAPGLASEEGRNTRAAARDGIEALLLLSLNSDPRFRYTVYEPDAETLKLRIGHLLEWWKAVKEESTRVLARARERGAAADEARIRRLIAQLGDGSWDVRDAAHRELEAAGSAAARLLALAAHSADLERASRSCEILSGLCDQVVAGDPAAFGNWDPEKVDWTPVLVAAPFLPAQAREAD